MEDINKRIIRILEEFFKSNTSAMARGINVPPPTLNNIVGNRFNKPSSDTLEKIINSLEFISPDWLLTGKGEMLREENTAQVQVSQATQGSMSVLGNGNNINSEFDKLISVIKTKDEQIARLLAMLEKQLNK